MYSIQEFSEKTGIPASTLRYYEKEGLFSGVKRTKGGLRQYSEEDVERANLICCLKNTGMPLNEIAQFVELTERGDQTLAERIEMLRKHQRTVLLKLREMQKYLDKVTWKINYFLKKFELHEDKT